MIDYPGCGRQNDQTVFSVSWRELVLGQTMTDGQVALSFVGEPRVGRPLLVQKDEGPSLSLAGPPGLALFL